MNNENKKNTKAFNERKLRMSLWRKKADYIERYFLHVAQETKLSNYFATLYVSQEKMDRQIQLFTGVHHIKSPKLHSEKGAALVVSQSVIGSVAITLYPYKSEKVSRDEPYIIWAVYDDPDDINERILDKCKKDFFTYIRVSSAVLTESRMDRLRINYLIFRSGQYTGKDSVFKVIFSKWFYAALAFIALISTIGANMKTIWP